MKYTIYQIDSFTKEKFRGNPAGVVLNAAGLSESQMQNIARELNNSETAFIFPSDSDDCDGVIRYYTPVKEVPTCGHATIAAFYAKAMEENLDSCILKIKTRIGILPIEIIKIDNDYQIIMTQGRFELSPPLEDSISGSILNALDLTVDELNPGCPIQIASTGHSKVMIAIKSREKLNSLLPDYNKLADISGIINCNGYFVFTFDGNNQQVLTHGRMFAPAIGINEDPVTGNANGPLGGYLFVNKLINCPDNYFEFNSQQGEKINRKGIINVKVTVENNFPSVIQIKGEAVIVFKTVMEI